MDPIGYHLLDLKDTPNDWRTKKKKTYLLYAVTENCNRQKKKKDQ